MADKSEELIKYMTVQVVQYMETSQEDRRHNRKKAKAAREPWLTRWFGIAPLGITLWWRNRGTVNDAADLESVVSGTGNAGGPAVKEVL
ncbi:YqzE family protein [Paenibacillus oenotherae]|uniref:YqzE family protein n=2 Tax=Paenibacillus oenotherae TaxID=1435645 RepID=A0ABS7D347_9BACL|nr:YqzE family protein [Paenibacillus oenotherae]